MAEKQRWIESLSNTNMYWCCWHRFWQLVWWPAELLGLYTPGLCQSPQQLHQQHREHGEHQQLASKGKSLKSLQKDRSSRRCFLKCVFLPLWQSYKLWQQFTFWTHVAHLPPKVAHITLVPSGAGLDKSSFDGEKTVRVHCHCLEGQ